MSRLPEVRDWRLDAIMGAVTDVALLLRPEGTIEYINEAGAVQVGKTSRDMIGRNICEFFSDDELAGRREMALRAVSTGEPLEFEDESGGRRLHHIVHPTRDEFGQVASLAVVVKDITAHAQVREALMAAEETIEQKDAALREVLGFIESERNALRQQVAANRDGIILPLLSRLRTCAGPELAPGIAAIESALSLIEDPFLTDLTKRFSQLTPRELEVCVMIRNGLPSKDIADRLSVSLHTVHKFRQRIRRKLGITNDASDVRQILRSM